ncbi:MAG: winged helix-turn-helix domain-containing protein [Candidatus Bathyarchaeia archaeon]
MEDRQEVERDRQRADVFDALGHPTRIVILKVLSEGALGFADLKKKTAIDSSGHLQHHLTKLNGLIKTDEYGKYCLSDQGKDALLTVQTVENASASKIRETEKKRWPRFNTKMVLKSVSLLLVALLIASSAITLYEYNQAVAFQKENSFFKGVNSEAAAYYNEFGVIPTTNVNSSFFPPVSMYRALQIAFEANGFNKESLQGLVVSADLWNAETVTNLTTLNGDAVGPGELFQIGPVTSPPADYSDVNGNSVIYQYVWIIQSHNPTSRGIPPLGFSYSVIDASTGNITVYPGF